MEVWINFESERAPHSRQRIRNRCNQKSHRPPGKQQPDAASQHSKHCGFGQQLPYQSPAAGPERRTHSDLLLACHGPRQLQTSNIGAGNQQHQGHRAHNQSHDCHLLGGWSKSEWRTWSQRDGNGLALLGADRISAPQLVGQHRHFGLRFFHRSARFQTPNQATAVVLTVADYVSSRFQQWKSADRKPDTGHVLVRSREILWRKPDYCERLAVELDRLAQNFPIGTEPALPKIVAEHHDWGSRARLFRSKSATHSGINPEHREVVL